MAHFIAGARLVYVKYTAAIAVSNCVQIGSVASARNSEIGSSHSSLIFTPVIAFLGAALFTSSLALAQPNYEQVRNEYVSTEGMLLDRHGVPIHELRIDMEGRRLPWLELADVSPALIEAVIRAEDKRFFEHGGVDWLAMGDAAFDNLFSSKPRGASTLSMQVAAMLELTLKRSKVHRTWGQKWDQIKAARVLEKSWTKRQILEAYLNLSTFRGELQGISTVSQALFGRSAAGLNDQQALLLAVLLRGPNASQDILAKRACGLAKAMRPPRGCEGLTQLAHDITSTPPNLRPAVALAPHVARALVSASARRVQSTLDAGVQMFVLEAMNRQLAALQGQHVQDAAVLVLDNASGDVLAYVANSGASSSARHVDGVRAARQAGSTLKPFLYELAIEQKLLTAASLVDDSAVNFETPSGLYVPQDYDRDFKGLVSLRTALSGSLNVPAVRTLALVGTDTFVDRLRALGFETVNRDGDYYGYSLALGSAEVSLWHLTNAYRTLASGGLSTAPRWVADNKPAPHRVMDRSAAYVVSDILADRLARSITFGLANPLGSRVWAAVKTGTSKDMRDNWCVGYSTKYTIGVWVGNFDGSPMWDVSGVTGAAPLWLEIMERLHPGGAPAPSAPTGVESLQVTFEPSVEPARNELFLTGTALTRVAAKPQENTHPAILYPGRGAIIAIDPDIPGDRQRVRFEATGISAQAQWRLNGEPVADGELWRPQPGIWSLSLHKTNGAQLDSVQFEVRGGSSGHSEPDR